MKKKMLLILLAVAVSVSMIAAATMAWFTDEATAGNAEFTAGTVDIELSEEDNPTIIGETSYENVNPGDSFDVSWTINNIGTKAVVFRIKPTAKWTKEIPDPDNDEGATKIITLSHKNVDILIADGDNFVNPWEGDVTVGNWRFVRDTNADPNKIGNYIVYYVGDPLSGSFNSTPGSATLNLRVHFKGEETTNAYQGATFTLGGKVEAVQSSNDAPYNVWDVDYYQSTQTLD